MRHHRLRVRWINPTQGSLNYSLKGLLKRPHATCVAFVMADAGPAPPSSTGHPLLPQSEAHRLATSGAVATWT